MSVIALGVVPLVFGVFCLEAVVAVVVVVVVVVVVDCFPLEAGVEPFEVDAVDVLVDVVVGLLAVPVVVPLATFILLPSPSSHTNAGRGVVRRETRENRLLWRDNVQLAPFMVRKLTNISSIVIPIIWC